MAKPIVAPIKKDLGEKEKDAKAQKLSPNGDEHRPFPWVEPFPESDINPETKEETVFVRAMLNQDIIMNGKMFKSGERTLPAGFAHQNAAVLSAPK